MKIPTTSFHFKERTTHLPIWNEMIYKLDYLMQIRTPAPRINIYKYGSRICYSNFK